MAYDLKSPPKSDSTVSFVWFSWFRKLYLAYQNLVAYVNTLPTTQGGNLKSQLLTTADVSPWTWPTGVDAVWVTAIGGGAGGSTRPDASTSGGGGGAGEYCVRYFYPRGAATTTNFTIGTGGAVNSNGNNTNFGVLILKGGSTGDRTGGRGWGGKGGGDAQTAPSSRVAGVRSVDEGVCTFSGANGGGGAVGGAAGFNGGGSEMWSGGSGGASTTFSGGGGGGSSPWGVGGSGGTDALAATSPASDAYGCGGGGGSNATGSTYNVGKAGANGCILLEWIGA